MAFSRNVIHRQKMRGSGQDLEEGISIFQTAERKSLQEVFREERAMTREEAIHELKEWLEQMMNHGVPNWSAKLEALDMAIHELEIQVQRAKCRKCEHYRFGVNFFPYCELNRDERKPFVCEFEERTE